MSKKSKVAAKRVAKAKAQPATLPSAKAYNEADLQGRVHAVLDRVFPWLPRKAVRFETKFRIQLGRTVFMLDGNDKTSPEGRVDVVAYDADSRPIALLELKKPDHKITDEDRKQGFSYANNLDPHPPLVVISNGSTTEIHTAHDKTLWAGSSVSEQQLAQTVQSALAVAESSLQDAIETLLGPSSTVWVKAVRTASNDSIQALTGNWSETLQPFIEDFSLPRKAARRVTGSASAGVRLTLLHGAPLAGKSNVLRQFMAANDDSPELAILYFNAHLTGRSPLRCVADLLSEALGWPASEDEVRTWLRNMSNRPRGHVLVLAFDGLGGAIESIRGQLEDLTSPVFGSRLRIVAAIDDTQLRPLTMAADGRSLTRIAKLARRVPVEPLDDDEFWIARKALAQHRMFILEGADQSREWRHPWLIRAHTATFADSKRMRSEAVAIVLPSMLGMGVLEHAAERFRHSEEVRRAYGRLAAATIAHIESGKGSPAANIEFYSTFTLPEDVVRQYIPADELSRMITQGYWRLEYRGANISMVIPRVPELLASEIAHLLAERLGPERKKGEAEAATWLVDLVSRIPLGAIVGARAILAYEMERDGSSGQFMQTLLASKPKRERPAPGTKAAMHFPGFGAMNLEFLEEGRLQVSAKGHSPKILEPDEGEPEFGYLMGNMVPWLILSHLASHRMEMTPAGGGPTVRADWALLLTVGASEVILREPYADWPQSYHSHQLSSGVEVTCHKSGIVEAVTLSMRHALIRDGEDNEPWLDAAMKTESLPLINRIYTALSTLLNDPDDEREHWFDQQTERFRRALGDELAHLTE